MTNKLYQWLWPLKSWVSLKISPFDGSYIRLPAVVTIALSCTIFQTFDVEEYHDLFLLHDGIQSYFAVRAIRENKSEMTDTYQ